MTSFSVQSFGCRVNQSEAFFWVNELQRLGLKYEPKFSQSDLILVNTCTLTANADRDARRFVQKISRINPNARLVLTGCLVERAPEKFLRFPQVWKILSNKDKKKLVPAVIPHIEKQERMLVQSYKSRALVKIQDGCNYQCSFCIIPSVKGKSKSEEKLKIIKQVKNFIVQGFREVILTGVHLCLYGLDMTPKLTLLDLLQELETIEGLGQVRLSSLDPRFLNKKFLDYLTTSKKICPHFHLSLQSGSDDVLKRMGRSISVDEYKDVLADLRLRSPEASLGADIIVGFPEESDKEFTQTYDFLQESPLSYFHVFAFSSRPGTKAANWCQVQGRKKKERASLLRALSAEKIRTFRHDFIGKESKAIVIRKANRRTEVLTPNYLKVYVPSCPARAKEEVWIRITTAKQDCLEGQVIS